MFVFVVSTTNAFCIGAMYVRYVLEFGIVVSGCVGLRRRRKCCVVRDSGDFGTFGLHWY